MSTAVPTVLISGASRGIGLEFARQYAAAGWRVHAACRHPEAATALQGLGESVSVHRLEVTEKASLDELARELKSLPIDLLIANAGVSGPRAMTPEMVDRDSWMEVLQINTIGPIAFAGAFRANLEKGKGKKAVALTSRLGSVAGNESGGFYVYRSSKAALNAVWRSLAVDWRSSRIACAVLHPGWVQTDMGGPRAELTPEDSVAGMRRVIDALDLDRSGRFFAWNGEEIPW
ncbi:MAG TPA: SDR family oxidoreductase [Stellaceae bacterium]|nr:SDR family oxidoreductase [Stellaceae bacterium]